MNPLNELIRKLFGDENPRIKRHEIDNDLGHHPTPQKRLGLRHQGFTKSSHEETKKRRKMAAKSRRINRK